MTEPITDRRALRPGDQTSEYKLTIVAMVLSVVVAIALAALNHFIAAAPAGSILATLGPPLAAGLYAISRGNAKAASSNPMAAYLPMVLDRIGQQGSVNVGSVQTLQTDAAPQADAAPQTDASWSVTTTDGVTTMIKPAFSTGHSVVVGPPAPSIEVPDNTYRAPEHTHAMTPTVLNRDSMTGLIAAEQSVLDVDTSEALNHG
jgi:hypothetical protein